MADEHTMGVEPIVVRHSELAAFRQCPLMHKLEWFEGWWDPAKEAGSKRELGTVWHEVLAIRYRYLRDCATSGKQPDEQDLEHAVGAAIAAAHTELHETLYWMWDGYIEKYGWDTDWEIIAVEQTMRVQFLDEDEQPFAIFDPRVHDWRPVLYSWTSDVLVRSREYRGVIVVDTKSTSQPMGKMDIDLSDQFGLYSMAWRRKGTKVVGQLVNQAKTKVLKRAMTLDERFSRVPSVRTPYELREIELDAIGTIRAMYSGDNLRRPYSSPDPRQCGWKCDFKEPHLRMRRNPPEKHPGILRAFGMQQGSTHGQ